MAATSHVGNQVEHRSDALKMASAAARRMGVVKQISRKHRLPKIVRLWRAGKLRPQTVSALKRDPAAMQEFRRQQRREDRKKTS